MKIFDSITPDDALTILKLLVQDDTNLARKIEQVALKVLSDVNIDEISEDVYFELNSLDVEDVWDHSGSTRYGYIDPNEYAWELFEETLAPFIKQLKKYDNLSLRTEAKNYCMGILKGIYKFENESSSEYKDWATDAPGENFVTIFENWKKCCSNPEDLHEMEEFIRNKCSSLARYCT